MNQKQQKLMEALIKAMYKSDNMTSGEVLECLTALVCVSVIPHMETIEHVAIFSRGLDNALMSFWEEYENNIRNQEET